MFISYLRLFKLLCATLIILSTVSSAKNFEKSVDGIADDIIRSVQMVNIFLCLLLPKTAY